jgi:hypothetical protein
MKFETTWTHTQNKPNTFMFYYSKTTRGFYCVEIHGNKIPQDAVAITRDEHRALFKAQSEGKTIQPDEKGYPVAVDPPPLTPEQRAEMALYQRDALMNEASLKVAPLQDAVDLDMATPDEERDLKAWKLYRVALNRIEQQPGFPTQIDWPKAPDEIDD